MTDEKTFIVPLRKSIQKAPKYRRAKKGVNALKEFLKHHMKADVKIGKSLNIKMWSRGIKNPPMKVKLTVTKDDKGAFIAELFGAKTEKKVKAKDSKKKDAKTEKTEKKAEEAKVEE